MTYSSPVGFDFEHSAPVTPENVASLALSLIDQITARSKWYRHDVVMVPFGGDFQYQNASINFDNMDIVINYIHSHFPDIEIQYATLQEYFDLVFQKTKRYAFNSYCGDFMPYANIIDSWWSGIFTSRPFEKSSLRRGLTNWYSTSFLSFVSGASRSEVLHLLDSAAENISVSLHHDAIPGTAKSWVMQDYYSRLSFAEKQLVKVRSLLSNPSLHSAFVNPLSWTKSRIVELPVSQNVDYQIILSPHHVRSASRTLNTNQSFPCQSNGLTFPPFTCTAVLPLSAFSSTPFSLHPVEVGSFLDKADVSDNTHQHKHQRLSINTDIKHTLSSLNATFSPDGTLSGLSVLTPRGIAQINLQMKLINLHSINSSAYIFRPDIPQIIASDPKYHSVHIHHGPVFSLVSVKWTSYYSFSFKIFPTGAIRFETEFHGKLAPFGDFIVYFQLQNYKTESWWTASAGHQLSERRLSPSFPLEGPKLYPPPVADTANPLVTSSILSLTPESTSLPLTPQLQTLFLSFVTDSTRMMFVSPHQIGIGIFRRFEYPGLPPLGLNQPLVDDSTIRHQIDISLRVKDSSVESIESLFTHIKAEEEEILLPPSILLNAQLPLQYSLRPLPFPLSARFRPLNSTHVGILLSHIGSPGDSQYGKPIRIPTELFAMCLHFQQTLLNFVNPLKFQSYSQVINRTIAWTEPYFPPYEKRGPISPKTIYPMDILAFTCQLS